MVSLQSPSLSAPLPPRAKYGAADSVVLAGEEFKKSMLSHILKCCPNASPKDNYDWL